MLAVSQALIPDPKLLLIDELSLGLAPTVVGQLIDVVHRIHATGLTIVVVEHDIAFVREVAERVTVMHYGRIFADGPLAEVTARQDVRDIYLGRA
jgi:branched-chain amino acid transport system ATP-binding protein